MKKSKFSESKIFQVLKEAESGVPVPGAVPQIWLQHREFLQLAVEVRRHAGVGHEAAERTRGREPAAEKDVRRIADGCRNLAGCPGGKVLKPSSRKEMAVNVVDTQGISIRRACRLFSISETCYRYHRRDARIHPWYAGHALHSSRNVMSVCVARITKGDRVMRPHRLSPPDH